MQNRMRKYFDLGALRIAGEHVAQEERRPYLKIISLQEEYLKAYICAHNFYFETIIVYKLLLLVEMM